MVLRAYAQVPAAGRLPHSQSHIESVLLENTSTARSLVALFEAIFDRSRPAAYDAVAAARAVTADIDALASLDTDRVLRAFASMIEATLRTNFYVTDPGSARARNVLSVKVNPELISELPCRGRSSKSSSTHRGWRCPSALRSGRPRWPAVVRPP